MAVSVTNPSINAVINLVFANDEEYKLYGAAPISDNAMSDYRFANEQDAHDPDTLFWQLRWGGNFVFVSKSKDKVKQTAEKFAKQ